jgi:HK97 family phage major capsid protein
MRKYLEKRLAKLNAKKEELKKRALASQDTNEVRSIQSVLSEIDSEISEINAELAKIDSDESRSVPDNAVHVNGSIMGNTLGKFEPRKRDDDIFASMEYRMAFKDYVQKGTPLPEKYNVRAGGDAGVTTTQDIGALIPTNILNEIIKGIEKSYGTIYAKVRKLNVQGGVKIPVANLRAKFNWISETTVSPRQKAGDTEFIEFSYNIGEVRVSQTLLSSIVSLSVFESEVTRIMVESFLEAMDKATISGTGIGMPLGIANDPRVTNVVEMTAADIINWTAWRTKLFSKIPIKKRGSGEFLFSASTVETCLLTMHDDNNRPLFKEAVDGVIGNEAGKFFGRETTLVEPDVIADFDTASAGDIIGVYWNPNDYGINTNLQFGIKRYFDDDKNEWVNKGLTVVDGKILDPSGCYIIKKKGT